MGVLGWQGWFSSYYKNKAAWKDSFFLLFVHYSFLHA